MPPVNGDRGEQAVDFLALGPELQAAILGRLPAKQRWEVLPLVCKAFQRLVGQPGSLWGELDVQLGHGPLGPALAQTLRQLRKRGALTRELRLSVPTRPCALEALVGLLPTCLPALASLDVGACRAFKARDLQLVHARCPGLLALDIRLSATGFGEAARAACSFPGLTRLVLSTGYDRCPAAPALRALLDSLRQLRPLRSLAVRLGASRGQDVARPVLDWPADLCGCLSALQSLDLCNCCGPLPSSLSELRGLASLTLSPVPLGALEAGGWGAIAALSSLRALDLALSETGGAPLPECMVCSPGVWLQLTSLRLALEDRSLREFFRAPGSPDRRGRCLQLPRLQQADIHWAAFVDRLDYGSMTSLRGLRAVAFAGSLRGVDVHALVECGNLGGLTGLFLGLGAPPLEALLLCAPALRSLELVQSAVPRLPLCLAAAKLTRLSLRGVKGLVLDAGAWDVLHRLPELQALELCVCECPLTPSSSRSLAYLRLISASLEACKGCQCHTVEWELRTRQHQQAAAGGAPADPDESSDED